MSNYKKKAIMFLTSQGITLFGSSIVQFALIWYVTMQTSSGAWVSAMTVAAYVPQFIVSFFAGVWADWYDRKKLIIFSLSAGHRREIVDASVESQKRGHAVHASFLCV